MLLGNVLTVSGKTSPFQRRSTPCTLSKWFRGAFPSLWAWSWTGVWGSFHRTVQRLVHRGLLDFTRIWGQWGSTGSWSFWHEQNASLTRSSNSNHPTHTHTCFHLHGVLSLFNSSFCLSCVCLYSPHWRSSCSSPSRGGFVLSVYVSKFFYQQKAGRLPEQRDRWFCFMNCVHSCKTSCSSHGDLYTPSSPTDERKQTTFITNQIWKNLPHAIKLSQFFFPFSKKLNFIFEKNKLKTKS